MTMFKRLFIISLGLATALTSFMTLASFADADVATAPNIDIAVPTCPVFSRPLHIGLSGSDVAGLQEYLNAKKYLNVSPTGYFGPLTEAAVSRWQADGGVVSLDGFGSGTFGPMSRAYFSRSCGSADGSDRFSSSTIQRLNTPGSVSLGVNDIVEVRNASFYFTLTSLSAVNATIDITPVGCWNSFPSDQAPAIRCMIAIVPIPPQTLSIGQQYTFGNHSLTLADISNGMATFSVQ
jgi:peptidoglycan hydrolase-like protein with peptidoglycan-binding domain